MLFLPNKYLYSNPSETVSDMNASISIHSSDLTTIRNTEDQESSTTVLLPNVPMKNEHANAPNVQIISSTDVLHRHLLYNSNMNHTTTNNNIQHQIIEDIIIDKTIKTKCVKISPVLKSLPLVTPISKKDSIDETYNQKYRQSVDSNTRSSSNFAMSPSLLIDMTNLPLSSPNMRRYNRHRQILYLIRAVSFWVCLLYLVNCIASYLNNNNSISLIIYVLNVGIHFSVGCLLHFKYHMCTNIKNDKYIYSYINCRNDESNIKMIPLPPIWILRTYANISYLKVCIVRVLVHLLTNDTTGNLENNLQID